MQQTGTFIFLGSFALALVMGGCGSNEYAGGLPEASGICEDHADCPASQICDVGSCVATCLNAAMCPSTGAISGTLQIETAATVGEPERWISARAGFVGTEYLADPQWIVFPGTDCVAIPNEILAIPCGLSVGDIHFAALPSRDGEMMVLSGEDEGDAFLEANQTEEGVHYSARQMEELLFQEDTALVASAAGGDLPGFSISLRNPAPILNVEVVSGDQIVAGEDYVLHWTPGNDAQILVKIEAMATPMGESVPTTIICPARDEAGTVTIPAKATALLDSEDAIVRIVRRNISLIPYAGAGLPATISQTLSWDEEVDTGRNR